MDRASQTEAVLQKKELLSSSVSTNSVDIDNPVPQEGGLEKVSGAIKKYLLLTLRCADPGCYSRAGQGQVPVTLSMPCHCGGTGTTEWGRFESHRWRVEYKCTQAQRSQEGPRLLRRMEWAGLLLAVECWVSSALL